MLLDDSIPSAQQRLSELSMARTDVQLSLQKCIKSHRPMRELETNQQVWLDARNLKTNVPSKKLAPRRYGPFKVIQKVSPVAYRLQLPQSMSKMHNVFHIDLLIPYVETQAYGQSYLQPPPDIIDGKEEYEVEEIVLDRKTGHSHKQQYLVRWKGYPASENSWVDAADLNAPELL